VSDHRGSTADRAWLAIAGTLFVAFFAVVLSHALTNGLCCGDDGAIALVAKNLAGGEGYSLPLNFIGESGKFPFHQGISTGPTLILPAAALIAVVGNQIWAPSLASALVSAALLILLWRAARRDAGAWRGAAFAAFAIVLLYTLTGGEFFVHWYALLGEMPTVLLLALAAILVGRANGQASAARIAFLAGLAGGLSIHGKLLGLIGALAIGGNFAWYLVAGPDRRKALVDGLAYTAGLLLPLVLFELFRWHALGSQGYAQWLVDMHRFITNQVPGAAAAAPEVSAWTKIAERLGSLRDGTGLVLGFFAIPVVVAVALRWRDPAQRAVATAAVLCAVAGLTYVAWWLLYSNGWPRYALIGHAMIVLSAAWAAAAMRHQRGAVAVGLVALMLVVPWHGLGRMADPVRYAVKNRFLENERVTALRALGNYVDRPGSSQSIVVGYWWATLVAVEYVSHGGRRTVGYNRLYTARKDLPGTFLLRDPTWDARAKADADKSFLEFQSHCQDRALAIAPYTLTACRFDAPK
jgi:hypothetical protein